MTALFLYVLALCASIETQEARFQKDYSRVATVLGLDLNPDDPRHCYNYRAAWKAGEMEPDGNGHFPSRYKAPNHPRRYVDGIDTITGRTDR